jgi:hypothetical protein
MSIIFDKLDQFSLKLKHCVHAHSHSQEKHDFQWPALTYRNPGTFRRADLDIIDATKERKLWMMHLCVYPHLSDPAPIYGFDIIAGPNKITGAFHDFSPINPDHFIMDEFHKRASKFIPSKKRELPDWARNIFSGSMVSAGNVRDGQELDDLLELAFTNLEYYLGNIGMETDNDYTEQHNWYAINQKKNPHTPRVMETLGVDPATVRKYIDECLFPEIPT